MKFLFIIQGEGRGHMTQAVALSGILKNEGHEVLRVLLGRSHQRDVPAFIKGEFKSSLSCFRSPNFIRTKDKKGIRVLYSILYNLLLFPVFIFEVFRLGRIIRFSNADRVVNFYDLIGALAYQISFSKKKYFVLSHHLYFQHPDFKWPEGYGLMRRLLQLHTFICTRKAKKLALSFRRRTAGNFAGLLVVPPLLRREIFQLQPHIGEDLVIYFLNEGYVDELIILAGKYSKQKMVLFTDKLKSPDLPKNIRLSPINGQIFLYELSKAAGVICTAGFETVCEAFYFGKKVRVIPSKNHYEQLCNAYDAVESGMAVMENFNGKDVIREDIDKTLLKEFRQWCNEAGEIYVKILCG